MTTSAKYDNYPFTVTYTVETWDNIDVKTKKGEQLFTKLNVYLKQALQVSYDDRVQLAKIVGDSTKYDAKNKYRISDEDFLKVINQTAEEKPTEIEHILKQMTENMIKLQLQKEYAYVMEKETLKVVALISHEPKKIEVKATFEYNDELLRKQHKESTSGLGVYSEIPSAAAPVMVRHAAREDVFPGIPSAARLRDERAEKDRMVRHAAREDVFPGIPSAARLRDERAEKDRMVRQKAREEVFSEIPRTVELKKNMDQRKRQLSAQKRTAAEYKRAPRVEDKNQNGGGRSIRRRKRRTSRRRTSRRRTSRRRTARRRTARRRTSRRRTARRRTARRNNRSTRRHSSRRHR